MKSHSLALLALALASGPAAAQTFSPERIRADVSFLADDLLEGRNTGERGYNIAAAYVANRYASLGLKPANGASYYQQVPFVLASIKPYATNAITIGGKPFLNGQDVVLSGTSIFPNQDLEAEVVFVGYGMEDNRYGFDDYRGLDVRGKVVALLSSLPTGAPSDVVADLADNRSRLAESKGAIGTIGIVTPASMKQLAWERMREYGSVPRLRWVHPDGKPNVIAPSLKVGGALGPAASAALFANAPMKVDALYKAIEDTAFRPKGFAIPGKIRFQRQSSVANMTSPNVVGLIPGSDPNLAKEVILFTAHLDHDGIVKADKGDTIMNGAMDNASGVAAMLEAARAFVDSGKRPKRTIMFAALTAEEDGLLGAEYLAHYPVGKDRKVVGVVNLDMPILTYDFQDMIAFGAEHSTMGATVDRAVASAGVKLSPDPVPEEGLFTRSDHYMFVEKGIPAVYLATGWAGPGKAAFQDFIANHYHRVSDEVTLPFDWQAAAKFARINYLIGRELADAPEAPRWYQGSYFGDKFAKDQPKAPKP
ncbi:MAG TPA: M20/M25/M40 family metallo-hydrolase [Sphingomicrobium sp.]|jgi:Zn-dependent M28 family amino/carboxypeptidase